MTNNLIAGLQLLQDPPGTWDVEINWADLSEELRRVDAEQPNTYRFTTSDRFAKFLRRFRHEQHLRRCRKGRPPKRRRM